MPARFITLEGIEGSGKTTQLDFVVDFLRGHGIQVVQTREPGGTEAGELIRYRRHAPGYRTCVDVCGSNRACSQGDYASTASRTMGGL